MFIWMQVKEQTGTDSCLDSNAVEVKEKPVVQHS